MGSHSVTCHPTQVNASAITPARRRVLDLPTPEGWKAELAYATLQCTGRESNISITTPTPWPLHRPCSRCSTHACMSSYAECEHKQVGKCFHEIPHAIEPRLFVKSATTPTHVLPYTSLRLQQRPLALWSKPINHGPSFCRLVCTRTVGISEQSDRLPNAIVLEDC